MKRLIGRRVLCVMASVALVAVFLSACVQESKTKGDLMKQSKTQNRSDFLLDVRTAGEFAEGHIQGAVLIPYTELEKALSLLPKDKNIRILVYCRSGRRADIAKTTLEKMGYPQVKNLGSLEDSAQILALPIVK